jgi:predicted O-linked N-acetylglucosamine transferase (SPINDLY family)
MNDGVVAVWARILKNAPGSILFLKTKQLEDPQIQKRTQERFQAFGVTPDRLLLEGHASRADYFKSYNRVDLALDPFPFPGGTTSVEGLWMGVPVLTKKGNCFIAHNGETIAHNSGQSGWIARDEDDYVAKALGFAADLRSLATLRMQLRGRALASPLFDSELFARRFGEAMNEIWRERTSV